MKKKCIACGSENLEPGKVQSTGKIYFRPKNAKFLSLKTSNIVVKGQMCSDCGHIMLVGGKEKVEE